MDGKTMRKRAEAVADRVAAERRRFHEHPELSWQEVETSRFIEERLRALGLENVKRGFGGTESGVTADLVGVRPGRTVALRADIDALPLTEENDIPYRSKRSGVMHACGHDAHAAILLGVADVLAAMRDELSGRVRFLFQPAEEAGTNSGAPRMIEEGALDGVDAIGGLHVWSPLPAGTVGLRSGPVMASADIWDLTVQGKGGHSAMPHRTVDPTITASLVVTALQTVVSREMDPLDTVV
ncbi:MAG TPA: amidohydrolase, partial [Synergistaceae bacterium]|nr:amidohydrolase [Synergistaceae bacterium]